MSEMVKKLKRHVFTHSHPDTSRDCEAFASLNFYFLISVISAKKSVQTHLFNFSQFGVEGNDND
jgi:hypothetical protein